MFRRITALLLLLVLSGGCSDIQSAVSEVASVAAQDGIIPITTVQVINQSTCPDAELQLQIAAINTQLSTQVGPVWPAAAHAKLSTSATSEFKLYLVQDLSTVPGWTPNDLGFHLLTNAHVGYQVQIGFASWAWQVAMSHESIEMIVDPLGTGDEICDPCENLAHVYGGYQINGQWVEDFTLPSYWMSGAGPWDYLGLLTGPASTNTTTAATP